MIAQNNLKELLKLLKQAENLASKFSGGYSGEILSAEEFHQLLKDSIENLEKGRFKEIEKLSLLFAPTSAWDDFIREEGIELGNEIFEILNKIQKVLNTDS
jgi:hypothetical protein